MEISGQTFRGKGHFKVTEVSTFYLPCSVSVCNVASSNKALVKFNKPARTQDLSLFHTNVIGREARKVKDFSLLFFNIYFFV